MNWSSGKPDLVSREEREGSEAKEMFQRQISLAERSFAAFAAFARHSCFLPEFLISKFKS
jgi:hypothetical protein